MLKDNEASGVIDNHEELLKDLILIMNSVSAALSLFVVITFLIFKRKFPSTMALCFSLAAFLMSLFMLLGPIFGFSQLENNHTLCLIQATGVQFSGSALVWWFFCISINLYLIVVGAWGCSLVSSLAPLLAGKYGDRGLWCWIVKTENGIWEFAFLYSEMAILAFVATILWTRTMFRVSKQSAYKSSASLFIFRHMVGVSAFIIIFATMLVHRLWAALGHGETFELLLMHLIVISVVGVVDFLVFGFTKDNYFLWKEFLTRCCKGRSSYEPISDYSPSTQTVH